MNALFRAGLRFSGLTLCLLLVGCPKPAFLYVMNPYDRYDHNRTLALMVRDRGTIVYHTAYFPEPTPPFFAAKDARKVPPPDQLAAAIVVPIFIGVPLPLSKQPHDQPLAKSDYEDLVLFLAGEGRGVPKMEQDDASYDLEGIERSYAPILEFLTRPGLDRLEVEALSARLKLTMLKGDVIVDARFPPAFFKDRVALRCAAHWFILYQPQNAGHLSRLTVVADHPSSQTQERKAPLSTLEPCQ